MDGIILINKEKNYTSHDVVNKVKKITKSKVGHTGTLDPNATGVLPLLLGNATKISKYLINHDKEYEVLLQLGTKTDTADAEGKIIEEKDVNIDSLSEENVKKVLSTFLGKQKQIPPMYSAIKVNGKKLYQYARQGQEVEIKPREIEIYEIKLTNLDKKQKQISLVVSCSKGTYIRSLCEDIADRLGTVGFMKELNRTKVGEFNIKDCVTIEEFEEKYNKNDFSDIITIEEIFKENPKIELDNLNIKQYLNGVKIKVPAQDAVYRTYLNNKFIGLGIVKESYLKRDWVFLGTLSKNIF